jgi:hypothetical protein
VGRDSRGRREHTYDDFLGAFRRGADRRSNASDHALTWFRSYGRAAEISFRYWGLGRYRSAAPESPASAQARLKALSSGGSMSQVGSRWFALLDRLGSYPVAQGMGASVARMGWPYLPALPPGEKFAARAGARLGGLSRGQQLA